MLLVAMKSDISEQQRTKVLLPFVDSVLGITTERSKSKSMFELFKPYL